MRRAFAAGPLALALALALPGSAEPSLRGKGISLLPDLARMQYAGQAGFLSAGAGYAWWRRKLEASVNYGYVPAFLAGRGMHVFSERNSFSGWRLPLPRGAAWQPALFGFAGNVAFGDRYRLYIPKGNSIYYWPDGLYFWVFAGTRFDFPLARAPFFKAIGIQAETGTVNQYLEAALANRSIGLGDILSLSVSVQFDL